MSRSASAELFWGVCLSEEDDESEHGCEWRWDQLGGPDEFYAISVGIGPEPQTYVEEAAYDSGLSDEWSKWAAEKDRLVRACEFKISYFGRRNDGNVCIALRSSETDTDGCVDVADDKFQAVHDELGPLLRRLENFCATMQFPGDKPGWKLTASYG